VSPGPLGLNTFAEIGTAAAPFASFASGLRKNKGKLVIVIFEFLEQNNDGAGKHVSRYLIWE
jgi:hypothetical protein